MKFKILYAFLLLPIILLLTITRQAHSQDIELIEAFPETFNNPLGLEYSHEGSSLLYIVSRSGKVVIKDTQNPDAPSTTFIDISDKVIASGELGLLGMEFSPNFQADNTFYLYYAYETEGEYYSTLARYKVSNGIGDPGSEERLFELLQPQDNHNGGQITFGPDGYLYIGLGDGGRSSRNLAQDTSILNGSILRIDVSSETGYGIPPDNPFVGDPSGRDEIYAWGFRNPWRMSFDKVTGDLWVADVGQKDRETIYIVEKGKNYGWPIVEGTLCYPIGTECDKTGLEEPIFEYPWNEENTGKSITGGFVYRGNQNPSLYGKYIYGDFVSKRIWALEINPESKDVISNNEIGTARQLIPSFGTDNSGELFIVGWAGSIYKFTPEITVTTAALKSVDGSQAVQLSWESNRDSGIDSYEIYKGSSVSDMSLLTTVSGTELGFIDPEPLDGSTFYTVRAIENGGVPGEMSDPVSYYRSASTISNSWQLMSVPYETGGESIENTIAYSFDGTYTVANQLEAGKGYWIRSTSDGESANEGEGIGIQSSTLQLNQGWNLVGGLVGELSTEFLSDAGGILNTTPMYGFNGSSYVESDRFIPGQGYLMYANDAGEVTLDLESALSIDPLKTVSVTTDINSRSNESQNDLNVFEFKSGDQSVYFYSSDVSVDSEQRNRFRVPPIAPNSVLDVRTEDGFQLAETNRFVPQVTVKEFPFKVQFSQAADASYGGTSGGSVSYELTVWRNGLNETIYLKEGESHLITEEFDRIEFLRAVEEGEIVRKTELLPSYPNPFNPTTTIIYRLAEQKDVSVKVFDAAGRQIATLVDREQDTGQYTLPFNASGLASGIYFVRFSAGDVMSTQKLTLIK